MISVTIQGLTKRFGSTTALDRLDLKIEAGEIFFLLGPSGCGKTTLLRSIAGFYIPEEGSIRFGDEDVTRMPPHQRNTGMMFQSYALWPHLTVAQNVAFGLEERKVAKAEITKRVGNALDSVKMGHVAGRKIAQLSGGQQQRIALARALVIRPRCLLLDEPLSNLDAKLRLEMRTEIRRVCEEFNLTAIYVTHDQKEALSIADRMAVLDGGRIQQVGTPREVYRRPTSKLVADFIGETDFLPGKIVSASAGKARVATEAGEFSGLISKPDWTPQAGEAVTLSIRPEAWQLQEARGAENSVAGRIASSIYLGEVAQYQFETAAGALKIFELNPRFLETSRDRELHATAAHDDVVVLQN
jgi:iron(III) transport system ATP-binding protein